MDVREKEKRGRGKLGKERKESIHNSIPKANSPGTWVASSLPPGLPLPETGCWSGWWACLECARSRAGAAGWTGGRSQAVQAQRCCAEKGPSTRSWPWPPPQSPGTEDSEHRWAPLQATTPSAGHHRTGRQRHPSPTPTAEHLRLPPPFNSVRKNKKAERSNSGVLKTLLIRYGSDTKKI